MIENKTAVAIIPARGGSRGLFRKNIHPLCSKPLIAWTIEKALRSKLVEEIIVSTEDSEIAAIAKECGANVPFLRPAELATDTASTYDVIRHAIENTSWFDYTLLLEPTSPLREDNDIDKILTALHVNVENFDSVVSVGRVKEHPAIIKQVVNGTLLKPFDDDIAYSAPRQDYSPVYFPYGVGYAAKTRELLEKNTFYMTRTLPYLIERYQCYEIDDIYDFICVEAVMKHEWKIT